ncbi:MAG TPA: alpha-ketoglutarate-dependent dioxygenase AlkB [Streptosporangiaceae bacterium]|nr:alpha-ketoglutarate-dependent dioxygenase AlkB [Streptosporangiaceae bacterium]
MALALQGSLLDAGAAEGPGPLGSVQRAGLAHGAWIDVLPGWLRGADELFGRLLEAVPWQAERRQMYDRVVDVPRLLCFYAEGERLPDPLLVRARDALNEQYTAELGEPFVTAGLCLYRDGRDSVAWHGDTKGRGSTQDTMVAIVSLGAPRALLLRPRPGTRPATGPGLAPEPRLAVSGAVLRHDLGHGDLLVMGGSCQRTWEHAVPKTTRAAGPRISVQFRPRGVR